MSMTRTVQTVASFLLLASACTGGLEPSTTVQTTLPSKVGPGSAVTATTTTTTTQASTTTTSPTTTVPPVTTVPPTTVAATTTTAAPVVTTTTLSETYFYLELRPDGLGEANFGEDEADTISYVTEVLGSPASDSGWVDAFANFGVCPSTTARVVSWTTPGKFDLYFFEGGTTFADDGVPHFGHYWYHGPDLNAFGVFTPDGITVGSTVLALTEAYGAELQISESFIPGAYFWRVDTDPADSAALGGWTTGEDDDSMLESIYGGLGCGE